MHKILILVLFAAIGNVAASTNTNSVVAAKPPKDARPNITTTRGITYERCKIRRVEPDGISVMHSKGIAKIPLYELPEEYQEKYGYDPKQASNYSRNMAEARRRAAARRHKQQQEVAASAESKRKVKELLKSLKKTAKENTQARKALAAKRRERRALTSDCRVLAGCTKDEVRSIIGSPSFTGSSGGTWFFNNFIDPESGDYATVHLDFEGGTASNVGW